MRNRDRSNEHPNSKRAIRRRLRKTINNEMKEFMKIQKHYFPDLIEGIKNVLDARHQSYVEYEISVVLYTTILRSCVHSLKFIRKHGKRI